MFYARPAVAESGAKGNVKAFFSPGQFSSRWMTPPPPARPPHPERQMSSGLWLWRFVTNIQRKRASSPRFCPFHVKATLRYRKQIVWIRRHKPRRKRFVLLATNTASQIVHYYLNSFVYFNGIKQPQKAQTGQLKRRISARLSPKFRSSWIPSS